MLADADVKTSRRAKHMRLGTKSCSECRRRKIRCIFPNKSESCTACRLHATPCGPQGTTTRSGQAPGVSKPEERLGIYERLLKQLFSAADIDVEIDGNVARLETAGAQLVELLHSARSPRPLTHGHEKGDSAPNPVCDTHISQDDQNIDGSAHARAPLMDFLGQSALVKYRSRNTTIVGSALNVRDIYPTCVMDARKLLPSASDLTEVLEATQKYWALWPLHPTELSPSQSLTVPVVKIAKSFIEESMQSHDPAIVAKAVMWLCLCIQQAPSTHLEKAAHLSDVSTEIVSSHLDATDSLLNYEGHHGFSRAGVTTLVLQTKCFVNMGRLRQAWLRIRRAVNQAVLLGLHLTDSESEGEDFRIWTTIWGYEQQLSLMLGVPQAVTCDNSNLKDMQDDRHPEVGVMHQISSLCGQINDRNQKHRASSYADTLALDEELIILRRSMPNGWFDNDGVDRLPLQVFQTRQISKLYFYHLKQLIHLPYMLKATKEKRYDYSRISVLEAIEGIMHCYRQRHLHEDGSFVMCFLVDFIAFGAGLVLATDLISQSSLWARGIAQQKWTDIAELISELKLAANTLNHPVAEQGAQLLEQLYLAHHGLYSQPDDYEAVVPFFGKVLVRAHHSRVESATTGCSDSYDATSPIVLGSNIFDLDPSSFASSSELDMDWTSILDDNLTYEWNWGFDE